jgi:hypothetical protein
MQQGTIDFPDPTAPANPEEVIRDEILSDLATRNADLLNYLRGRLKVTYRFLVEDVGREFAYVTADDARRILDADRRFDGVCRNFLGALFKGPGWKSTGAFHKSRTPGSHANRLLCWRFDGE